MSVLSASTTLQDFAVTNAYQATMEMRWHCQKEIVKHVLVTLLVRCQLVDLVRRLTSVINEMVNVAVTPISLVVSVTSALRVTGI